MRVAIGCDHAGFPLKEQVKEILSDRGIACRDFGTFSEGPVDYPDVASLVAEAVASGACDLGVLLCGTGLGMAIVANKVPGVRAAVCHDAFSARCAREHNDANVLAMGGRVIGPGLARTVLETWLDAEFTGGRHAGRVDKIREIERKYLRPPPGDKGEG